MAIFSWMSKLSPKFFSQKASFVPAQENTWLKCTHDYATDFISDAFDKGLYMLAQVVKGQIVGWTFVPISRLRRLSGLRKGKLLWARK